MTREEAIEIVKEFPTCLQDQIDNNGYGDARFDIEQAKSDIIALNMAIEALSVEPCEDAISFPKGTLKKRGKGYVVYNPEWLKENWRTELRVMGIECEDAIGRAAAIKAMDDLEQEDIELYGCSIPEGFDGKRAIEALQSLPSVTPNMSENPTSSNCSEKPNKWIPVSERLPEEKQSVLVWCHQYKNIYCAYLEKEQWWIFGAFVQIVPNEVVAWMPLPEPYKVESED